MNKVTFSVGEYETQHDTFMAWYKATELLTQHNIPFKQNVYDEEIWLFSTDNTKEVQIRKRFSITFEDENDFIAYQLMKD